MNFMISRPVWWLGGLRIAWNRSRLARWLTWHTPVTLNTVTYYEAALRCERNWRFDLRRQHEMVQHELAASRRHIDHLGHRLAAQRRQIRRLRTALREKTKTA